MHRDSSIYKLRTIALCYVYSFHNHVIDFIDVWSKKNRRCFQHSRFKNQMYPSQYIFDCAFGQLLLFLLNILSICNRVNYTHTILADVEYPLYVYSVDQIIIRWFVSLVLYFWIIPFYIHMAPSF